MAVLEAAELAVDTSIEAILIAEERVDEFSVDPFIKLAVDRVGEEADEDTIDKIARIEAILDKIAGDEAINDNTIDPFVELVVLAADRVGEEADEDIVEKIVFDSSIEATIDNTIDPYIELAVLEAAELAVDTSIEAILVAEERIDEIFVDTSIEAILVAEEQVDEFSVDPLIEAIYSRGTTDKEAEGPRFKPSSH